MGTRIPSAKEPNTSDDVYVFPLRILDDRDKSWVMIFKNYKMYFICIEVVVVELNK